MSLTGYTLLKSGMQFSRFDDNFLFSDFEFIVSILNKFVCIQLIRFII